jgi:hypothetical protein
MIQQGLVMNKDFLLKKKWYLILIGVSVVGILITIILRVFTPKNTVLQQTEFIQVNKTGDQTVFKNIKFIGDIPINLKERLPLVSLQQSNTSADYIRDRFIKNHNLAPVAEIDGLWKGDEYTLSFDETNGNYLFYSNFLPEDTLLTNKNKAIEVAENYVLETFSQLPFKSQKKGIRKFSGIQQMSEKDFGAINAMEIPFTYSIEDIPLYIGHENTPPLSVLINNEYEIQKIVFQTVFFYPLPREESFNIISISEAVENINNRQHASIISAYESETGIFSLEEISEGELTSVSLEYRADLDTKTAYPFYRFSGELENNEGKIITAEIITPAVKIAE